MTMNLTQAKGDWALITGATAGIGREFAMQLAAAGLNVVLVARRTDLLAELAEQLTRRYGVQTLAVPVDLTGVDAVAGLSAQLKDWGIRVRLLVNNAAIGRWGRFEAASLEIYETMIALNVKSVVALCHHFLKDLTSFPTSAVVNISSPGAYNPVPYMAVYAASKAFVSSFSQALYGEWRERGVLVQTLVPGPTETEFDTLAGAYESAVMERGTPEQVVRVSLSHLAADTPVAVSAKGTFIQRLFANLCPPKMVITTVAKMFRPPGEK